MPAGRPCIILDESRIAEFAAKGYIQSEIAAFFGVSPDTIARNYADAIKRGKELLCGQLRAKQAELALAGNTTMLVWLGKNLLGQTDRTELRLVEELKFGDFASSGMAEANQSESKAAAIH